MKALRDSKGVVHIDVTDKHYSPSKFTLCERRLSLNDGNAGFYESAELRTTRETVTCVMCLGVKPL